MTGPKCEEIIKQHVAADTMVLTYTTETGRQIKINLTTGVGQTKLRKLMIATGMEHIEDSLQLVGRSFNPEDAF